MKMLMFNINNNAYGTKNIFDTRYKLYSRII